MLSVLSFAFIITGLLRPTDKVADDLVMVSDIEVLATIRTFFYKTSSIVPPTNIRFPLNCAAPMDTPK